MSPAGQGGGDRDYPLALNGAVLIAWRLVVEVVSLGRPVVYITRKIPDRAVDLVRESCEVRIWDRDEIPVPRQVLLEEAARSDGLLTMVSDRVDGELLDAAPTVKVVGNMAVGYDNIVVPDATARGVMVTNTPGVLTETTADLAWGLILATARRIAEGARFVAEGRWRTWSPMFFTGLDVYGTTLGIIGLGRIGEAVARRAKGFGMRVIYYNRSQHPKAEEALGATYAPLDDLLRESDFVSIHTPLTPETRHLIGERELALMKPTACLINTSRGPVVDEGALYRALASGRIWAAGLDVFEAEPVPAEAPLISLPNVVAIPHIGSATIATRTRMAATAAENVVAGVTGKRPAHLVNPEVWSSRTEVNE